jgi:hypothetical protein
MPGCGDDGITEDLAPGGARLVGGDDHQAAFVADGAYALFAFQLDCQLRQELRALAGKVTIRVNADLAEVLHECHGWIGHRCVPFRTCNRRRKHFLQGRSHSTS